MQFPGPTFLTTLDLIHRNAEIKKDNSFWSKIIRKLKIMIGEVIGDINDVTKSGWRIFPCCRWIIATLDDKLNACHKTLKVMWPIKRPAIRFSSLFADRIMATANLTPTLTIYFKFCTRKFKLRLLLFTSLLFEWVSIKSLFAESFNI